MFGILWESRIGLKPLASLCRRLAISLSAGVDVRAVWLRESNSTVGIAKRRMSEISDSVAQGGSISDGLKQTGQFFPEFFRDLVKVGEQSGHLPEIFRQLADHYEHQLKLRRTLVSAITFPLVELTIALGIVGLVIWLMGLPALKKSNVDLLGFGLTGNEGLATYLAILAVAAFLLFLVYRATVRGALWVAPVQRAVMKIPKLGRTIETIALARLAWAMHVTLNSGMEIRKALKLSLRSTQNVIYTRHIPSVVEDITNGDEVYAAFSRIDVFPLEFLEAVHVGEETGNLSESMENLAGIYQEEARTAMGTMAILLGFAIWGMIAAGIIFIIFRIFSFYSGVLNDALNMKH